MYCRYCGASIDDDSVYCEQCGKQLQNDFQKTHDAMAEFRKNSVNYPSQVGVEGEVCQESIAPPQCTEHNEIVMQNQYTGEKIPGFLWVAILGLSFMIFSFSYMAIVYWENHRKLAVIGVAFATVYALIVYLLFRRNSKFRTLFFASWVAIVFSYFFGGMLAYTLFVVIVTGICTLYFYKSTKVNLYLAYGKRGDNHVL